MSIVSRAIRANQYFQQSGCYSVPTLEEEKELASILIRYRRQVAGLEDGRVPDEISNCLIHHYENWESDVKQMQLEMAYLVKEFTIEFNHLPRENGSRREKVMYNFLKRMSQRMRIPSDGPVFIETKELLDNYVNGWMTISSGNELAVIQYMLGLRDFRGRTPMGV